MRQITWRKHSPQAALALAALLVTGCGGGATVSAATTPVAAQQTAQAAPVAAALATRAAQATVDSRIDATLGPQLTATAHQQATSSSAPALAATSTPLAAQPSATPLATPVPAASVVSTTAYTADFPHWPVATPGGADPASDRYDAATSAYRIVLTAADHAYVHWQYAPEGRAYGDFTLDVDGQALSGPPGGSWGVLFRAQPQRAGDKTNARYDLIVTPSKQEVSVNWTSATGQGKVLALTTVPAIHAGNALNHVRLAVQGDRVTVAINGQAVGSVTGPSTTPGAIGIIVLQPSPPAGSSGMDVAFSHLVVAPLPAQ